MMPNVELIGKLFAGNEDWFTPDLVDGSRLSIVDRCCITHPLEHMPSNVLAQRTQAASIF